MTRFFIGADDFGGVFKLQEECAELSVVLAKLVTVDAGPYYDGRNLPKEIVDELADVVAAANFYMGRRPAEEVERYCERLIEKGKRFEEWDRESRRTGQQWNCPINYPGCTRNCGSYGCGN